MIKNRRKFLLDTAALGMVVSIPKVVFGNIFNKQTRYKRENKTVFPEQVIGPDENGVFIIDAGEHKPEEIKQAVQEIEPIDYEPKSDRWLNLSLTASALSMEGGDLKVVMLGDSIVNDTYRSQWYDLFQAQYPNCNIKVIAIVRGSTGCWWYKDQGRIKRYVIPEKPDLLIIGGISQKNDTDSIKEVIQQVRTAKSCDVLLMTGVFGEVDPHKDNEWSYDIPLFNGNYRKKLYELALDTNSAFFDMNAYWGQYIRSASHEIGWYHRDQVHANIRGEQVIGHILARYFARPLPRFVA